MAEADAEHTKMRPPATEAEKAIARAKSTGVAVPVPSLTDDYSETVATPEGHLQKTQHVERQRVKQNGAWADLDATLVTDPRGGFRPKASGPASTCRPAGRARSRRSPARTGSS